MHLDVPGVPALHLVDGVVQNLVHLAPSKASETAPSSAVKMPRMVYLCQSKTHAGLTRWCRPRCPVLPMYMPGRFLTGSRPSNTCAFGAGMSIQRHQVAMGLQVQHAARQLVSP